jgi:cobalt-zinc-cadmium efflux system outer membrane protein
MPIAAMPAAAIPAMRLSLLPPVSNSAEQPQALAPPLAPVQSPAAMPPSTPTQPAFSSAATDWPAHAAAESAISARVPHVAIRLAGAEQAFSPEPAPRAGEQLAPAEHVDASSLASLSLFAAIEASLVQNPDLVALRRGEGVSAGVLGVAKTYPFNPFLQVQATPIQTNPQGGSGSVYHYVLLMQQIQWAHQQKYREEAALAALTSVRWNIHQAELLNVAQTQRLFFTALYQRGIRDLAAASARLNEELARVSQRQLEAGQASAADVAIVRLDARSTRRQAQLAEATYQTALLDLRRQLNLPMGRPLELEGDLLLWQWPPPSMLDLPSGPQSPGDGETQRRLAELVAGRPDVMAARADLATARSNLSLARASRHPDLQIGPYYERDDLHTNYWGFRAQSDIPVINSGMPMVRQRDAEVRQRSAVWEQLQERAMLEAQTAIDRYQRARRMADDVQTDISGSLPSELQRLEEQFRAGEVDLVRVFTARSSLLQLRRAQLDALNELAQAAANLTAATGLPPDCRLSPSPPVPIQ